MNGNVFSVEFWIFYQRILKNFTKKRVLFEVLLEIKEFEEGAISLSRQHGIHEVDVDGIEPYIEQPCNIQFNSRITTAVSNRD